MSDVPPPVIEENGAEFCPRCGEALPDGGGPCAACGWLPERVCFCGTHLPADVTECPNCGAQWAKVIRIRRRSRSTRVRSARVARSALIGAVAAVMGSALANLIVSGLAQRSTPDGEIPQDIGLRLYYAWYTLTTAVRVLLSRVVGGGLGLVVLTALIGAGAGVVWYLAQVGHLKWNKRSRRGTARHRAERRSTRRR